MKAGFVNIFGRPNAGKSTLLNNFLGQKLAIVSPKVQTTRHRIKGFLTVPGEYQIIFSDTPGIIEAKYKLHEKMMQAVKGALEDADVALLIADASEDPQLSDDVFSKLRLKVPSILLLNKTDKVSKTRLDEVIAFYSEKKYAGEIIPISAIKNFDAAPIVSAILNHLPEGEPFFSEDDLTDLPTKFFVSEIIREKIFLILEEELPYQSTVLINEFKERESLIKIQADIIVQRESQKAIIIGKKGATVKEIGMQARTEIEQFLEQKVFLELFVKVRPKWRDNDNYLKEYGYH